MIYTCTLNPSLDYYLNFQEEIQLGKINRSTIERYEAGGKGINISIALSNMEIHSRAFGFLGGFTKEYYIHLLEQYQYLEPSFTIIESNTRINVKMHEENQDTNLNAAGPVVTVQEMQKLIDKVERLDESDYFCFAGFVGESLEKKVVGMLQAAMQDGTRVILDTNTSVIKELIGYHPFLIKMNDAELASYFGKESCSLEEAYSYVKELVSAGSQFVLVYYQNRYMILGSEEGVFCCDAIDEKKLVNPVGTGDSMTAGFLLNYQRSSNAKESFDFAVACARATAYSDGIATKERVALYDHDIVIEQVS